MSRLRIPIPRQFPAIASTALLAVLSAHCEKQPELPPELRQAESQAPDLAYTAILNGPERLVLAGVRLEVGLGVDGPTVTLMGRGASDEALSLTGNSRRQAGTTSQAGDALARKSFEIVGPGKTWLGPTAGIRTILSRYQAETATIHVDRVADDAATGRLEGTFWRFDRREPTLRPPTKEQFNGTFVARVIR